MPHHPKKDEQHPVEAGNAHLYIPYLHDKQSVKRSAYLFILEGLTW
jgi:hypothetical protein